MVAHSTLQQPFKPHCCNQTTFTPYTTITRQKQMARGHVYMAEKTRNQPSRADSETRPHPLLRGATALPPHPRGPPRTTARMPAT